MFPSRFGGRWSLLGGWKPCAGVYSVGRGWRGDEGISVGSLHGAEDAAAAVEKGKRRKMMMMATAEGGDADDEEDVCRICPMTGEDDSPLYYPCACSGNVEYVHQECLLQWLNHSNARQCEVHFLRVCG